MFSQNVILKVFKEFGLYPPSFQIINVDWIHVESRAGDIAKSDKGVHLLLGQLIDE